MASGADAGQTGVMKTAKFTPGKSAQDRPVPSAGSNAGTASIDKLGNLVARVAASQELFAKFDQASVDRIFRSAALVANQWRIPLAVSAVNETGMGLVEDKVLKNHFAAEHVFNRYRDEKTCGIIEEDAALGIRKIAEPIGIIAGVVPVTNPTSTVIFKCLLALKTRNSIIFAPHPRAKKCTAQAARLIRDAVVAAGAPPDVIGWIDEPTVELTTALMRHPKVALILATGGPGMVKAAYSSGKPALGVGAGNTPALIDESADVRLAVNSILMSKTFDNGMICASEQSIVAADAVYPGVCRELEARGAHLLTPAERSKLAGVLLKDGKLNADIVGQSAPVIAALAGFAVPEDTKVLVADAVRVDAGEPLAYEKLSPVLGLYRVPDFEAGVEKAAALVEFGGMGHTAVLYTDPVRRDRITAFADRVKVGRCLVNMPASQGAIGDLFNFQLTPSLTLGCGTWGGNSVSENVGIKHLMNIKTVADRRENMLWFRVPPKIYHGSGILGEALREIAGRRRAFIVSDGPLVKLGYAKRVTAILDSLGIIWEIFSDVEPDPTLQTVRAGAAGMIRFQPDVIIAIGGGSPMDAAKIMHVLYEHPGIHFEDLAMRFMDIRKRIYKFPAIGSKALMVAIPTTSGTGSEVTPFAVVTDEMSGVKYPIADYALTPGMAIVDSDLVMDVPKKLTAYAGFDALVHCLESLVSVCSSEYSKSLALEASRLLFRHLPAAYSEGQRNREARDRVHNAATLAGMSFANAFLGICHSLAHKLGSEFHLPHGLANAYLILPVMRYNAAENPRKQTAFSEYSHPMARTRYAQLAAHLEIDASSEAEAVDQLMARIAGLKSQLDLPATLQEGGVKEADFLAKVDQMAVQAFDDQCTGTNPRFPLIAELRGLYLEAYYGTPRAGAPRPRAAGNNGAHAKRERKPRINPRRPRVHA